jgi:hypothetical protein
MKREGRRIGAALTIALLSLSCLVLFSPPSSSSPSSGACVGGAGEPCIVATCGKGYLVRIDGENGKYLLHVEGTPYEMGYQHGYLLAEGVYKMVKEYPKVLLRGYGIPEEAVPLLLSIGNLVCAANERFVPLEYILEMRGIADGARARGYQVSYEEVRLINMAFDAILSIAYPIVTPLLPLQDMGVNLPIACNAFVAFGEATKPIGGKVLMGRDFMFTEEVFGDYALLIEQFPKRGHPFISVTAPSFVGVTSAMNLEGVSIGMDMIPGMDTRPIMSGMGCLLIARKVIQYASDLPEAINIIKNAVRGVPWAYPIGSPQGGAVVESSADFFAVRYTDYRYPKKFRGSCLPDQIEDKDDLVVLTNHFIVPEMILKSKSYAIEDSLWRYETLTSLLLESYGKIDEDKGRALINFLSPLSEGPGRDYYGNKETVNGTTTLYNNTDRELWALYRLFRDPWVHYKLTQGGAKQYFGLS